MARRKCYSSVTMMLMQNYLEDLGGGKSQMLEQLRCSVRSEIFFVLQASFHCFMYLTSSASFS